MYDIQPLTLKMTRKELNKLMQATQTWGFRKMARINTYRQKSYQSTILAAVSGTITVKQVQNIARQLDSIYEQRTQI